MKNDNKKAIMANKIQRHRRARLIKEAKKNSKSRKMVEKWENTFQLNNIKIMYYTPCIYFLKKNGTTVYIGETTSLGKRISDHALNGKKDFDAVSFTVFKGSDKERKFEEEKLIRAIKPIYNITHVEEKKIRLLLTGM